MYVLQFFGIKTYEAEVELLHLRDIPLERFQNHIVTGRDVHRTAQTLLCADQYAVDGGIELSHDALPFLEGHVAFDHKHRTVRKAFAEMILVKVERRYGGAADSHLAGNLPYQFLDISCLVRNPVAEIAIYQVRDGARLDEQLDLSHEPKPGILLRVSRTVVIQLANAAEFLDNDAVNLVLAFSRADRMGTYLVLLACEVPELAGDDGLSDKLRQFLLVVHVLVLLLYAEYGGFSGAMTGTEKHMASESRERLSVMPVAFFLYLLVSVLVVYPVAPADHVDGIVVQQFKLAVQFRDVVPRGGSRVEYLVFETAENAQDKPCPL